MKVSDAVLRELYQRRTSAVDRSGCPAAEELAALARGELAPAERRRLANHLSICSSCSLEARLAAEVAPWSEELARGLEEPALGKHRPMTPTAGAPQRRRPWLSPPLLALAGAALLALAAGLWLVVAPPSAPPDDVLRGDVDASLPASGSELGEAPARLAWPRQPAATGYRVVLFDASAERIWESVPVSAPELVLPREARDRLRPGNAYLWLVEVEGPGARRELGPYRFRLAP